MGLSAALRNDLKCLAITCGLEASWLAARAGLGRDARGRGAIFTLHHVRPYTPRAFDPNAGLAITPQFLSDVLDLLQGEGYLFCPLHELPERLAEPSQQPLAAFTLDDGYRDNLQHAAPMFARYRAPFTVFVTAGFVDRTHTLWWETLDTLIDSCPSLDMDLGGGRETFRLSTPAGKTAAFTRIAAFVRAGPETPAVAAINQAARENGIDPDALADGLVMTEAELHQLTADPLASLGAHTISHRALALLPEDAAREEMDVSAERVARITGRRPTTIAYPYGDRNAVSEREHRMARDLGFTVGVLTQPGTLATAPAMPTALPRISINGLYQKRRHVAALASGIPFRLPGG